MEVNNFSKVIDQFITDVKTKNIAPLNSASVRKLSSNLFFQLKNFEESSPTGKTAEWVNLKDKITTLENELHRLLNNEVFDPQIHQTFKEMAAVKKIAEKQLQSSKHSKVESVIANSVSHRSQLSTIRSNAREQLQNGVSAEKVSRHMSDNMGRFVSSLYQEAIDKLGPPPCDYCLVVFGSMARQESGPYPDVDNMLIVEKKTPESLKYFTKVNQYVADRIHRLGEGDALGKAGIRFCPGDLNPSYQRYDFRYSDNPRNDFLLSLEQEHNDKSQTIENKKIELTNMADEIDRLEKDLATTGDNSLKSKIDDLKFDHRMLGEEIEYKQVELENSKYTQLTKTRELLDKSINELDFAKQENAATPSKANQDKVDALQRRLEAQQHELKRMEGDFLGGQSELFVEPSLSDATLADLSSYPEYERERIEFLGVVINDSLPVYGNKDLYTQYIALRPSVSSPGATQVKERAEKNIKRSIDGMKNNKVHPQPARDNTLTEMVQIKEELYRFPQALVANLSLMHGVEAKNTFDRIRALRDAGVFDKIYADKLLQTMDQLVKFRILAQSNYGEEYELVTPVDWKSFNSFYTSISEQIDDLSAKYPDIAKKIQNIEKEIDKLEIKASTGDVKAEADLKLKKEERNQLVDIDRTIIFRRNQRSEWSKIAKKEFDEKRPNDSIDKAKTPSIPDTEWKAFNDNALPVLHHLYKMSLEALKDEAHFDVTAYSKPL